MPMVWPPRTQKPQKKPMVTSISKARNHHVPGVDGDASGDRERGETGEHQQRGDHQQS